MRDKDIRAVLKPDIHAAHPDAAIFDEFPLCRVGRADLAAVNSVFLGYEIKSDCDSLNRLPLQVGLYQAIFDYIVVVAARKHLKYARAIIPSHWGISCAEPLGDSVTIRQVRQPKKNRHTCLESQIGLLWRNEAVRILRQNDIRMPPTAGVREIWATLASIDRPVLLDAIRAALKVRHATQSAAQRTSCGGSSPIGPTPADCPCP